MPDNAQHPDSADARQPFGGRTLPVGARFPRGWPESTSAPATATVRRAWLPPVGCRFPRAGQIRYSEPDHAESKPVPGPPDGAGFPRSAAWHSETLMESTLFV